MPAYAAYQVVSVGGLGLLYAYITLSFRCIASGLPCLVALSTFCVAENARAVQYPRILTMAFLLLNFSYWLSSTSYILYPAFASLAWIVVGIVSIWRFDILRQQLRPLQTMLSKQAGEFEQAVSKLQWPKLDFDGQGILACAGSTLDLSQLTFTISDIDFSYEVDANTKIIARIDCVRIRLARDITITEVYTNVRGDGTAASEARSFSTPSRTSTINTVSSVPSRLSSDSQESVQSSPSSSSRRLPPIATHAIAPGTDAQLEPISHPAKPVLPPRLPPRKLDTSSSVSSILLADDMEREESELKEALRASLLHLQDPMKSTETSQAGPIGVDEPEILPQSTASAKIAEKPSSHATATAKRPPTDFFFPENEDTDDDFITAAFDQGAIHHSASLDNTESNGFDEKAAIAANLVDQTSKHQADTGEGSIQLSTILRMIPWWLKITLGPLATRLILAPVIWLHPIIVTAIAATTTGKRITNLMETGGLRKAHPNQEIFRLIRKVFLWLESGDISIILSDVTIRPHVPISADHDVRIDVKACQPTAYRNVDGVDDVLAKIDGLSASFRVPTFLLPNHETEIPKAPRSSIPFDILLSLPGVFNRELLTIGAAFIKATTMMDLRQTAQSRPPPPSLNSTQFSFKSLGLAVKQAAGDLAKQKGVQWGVRDAELAKWTSKLARLMGVMRVNVGSAGEIPVDLMKVRRKASMKEDRKRTEAN